MARTPITRTRITRSLAALSLMTLLTACGGERGRDREEGFPDRETPSYGAPQDDEEDRQEKREGKESRDDRDDDDE